MTEDVNHGGARNERRVPVLLFAAAIILYVPGLWWGLPEANAGNLIHPWGTDELAPMGFGELYAVILHATRPQDPRYPFFHYIIEAIAAGPYLALLWVTGGLRHASATYPYGFTDPVGALKVLTLVGRLPSLLMAAGTIVVARRTASVLWGRSAGLAAGVLALVMYPMFYYSRTSNVDGPALFWASLGLLVFARCLRTGVTRRRAIRFGLYAALATATKDANYAVFIPLAPVLLYVPVKQIEPAYREARALCLAAGAGVGALVYAFASGLAWNPTWFVAHVTFIRTGSPVSHLRQAYRATPATFAGFIATIENTIGYVNEAIGPVALLAALCGALTCAWRRDRALALLLGIAGLIVGVILPVRFVEFRFVLPIAYIGVLFAGYAMAWSFKARTQIGRRAERIAGASIVVAFILAAGWPLMRGVDLTWQMLHDSRYDAARWLSERTRPGDRVTHTDSSYKLPRLKAGVVSVMLPLGEAAEAFLRNQRPEFVTVIPVLRGETTHEHLLPERVYQKLRDGSLGYRQAAAFRTKSLFDADPITYVNPLVTIFVPTAAKNSPD